MPNQENTARLLPDVAVHAQPHLAGALDWVGMADIQVPVLFDAGDGQAQRSSARVGAFVNLNRPDKRGIHMSRLYLQVEQALSTQTLNASMLHALLRGFLESHKDLSDRACLSIRFEYLVRRPALKSANSGWRAYPVCIEASLTGDEFLLEFGTEVVYSSTCPASAALSRQLIQDQFASDFDAGKPLDHAAVLAWLGSEKGIVATPHAQRSVARLRIRPVIGAGFNLIGLIDRVERALGTPVQTAVKREDEQAFALANGGNLMFCEDAARRIQKALDADAVLGDFHIRVEHQESLHPHDAVAYASKGVEGGYGSTP
ncbi:GTP cyclohydrolase FolE2 [Rhodanobacter denitrificans]|uniref:GTP cyclohydrolase FolE2 n=1 Tax=Rhodanobacter denitrificans TaxID=666685 RepID=M4NCE5_9GAMM|nr:GTP cyclohydrolase FolE2 [Rhodanobacter denitrificans]AGG88350.1 GTP cyclohydrolase I [Rhodanobacter denitrificans]UJM87491.1 GTP cyclohydrolase FolE2 [Rhodanobacter denitrificans]